MFSREPNERPAPSEGKQRTAWLPCPNSPPPRRRATELSLHLARPAASLFRRVSTPTITEEAEPSFRLRRSCTSVDGAGVALDRIAGESWAHTAFTRRANAREPRYTYPPTAGLACGRDIKSLLSFGFDARARSVAAISRSPLRPRYDNFFNPPEIISRAAACINFLRHRYILFFIFGDTAGGSTGRISAPSSRSFAGHEIRDGRFGDFAKVICQRKTSVLVDCAIFNF